MSLLTKKYRENRTKNDDILDFEYEYILGILKEVE